jgi:hypothetical protein
MVDVVTEMSSDYIDDYHQCERTYATLRIFPKNDRPDDISTRLGLEPTSMQVAHIDAKGRRIVDSWFLSSKDLVESRDSRRHVDWLLDRIEPAASSLAALMESGTRIDVCCFWESATGNGGPLISPRQMRRLVALNLEIWWDVWC